MESRVALGTAEKLRRDLTLKLGSAQANVEVKKVTNNLSPDDASIAAVIDNQTIPETPLYLRNWDDLLCMVAGVQISRYTQQSGATVTNYFVCTNACQARSPFNSVVIPSADKGLEK